MTKLSNQSADSSPAAPSSRRRLWLGAGVAGVAAVAGAGLAWWRLTPGAAQPGVEEALWRQQFTTPEGAPLPMAAWRGQPLIVNFWATWCPPCVRELPLLSEFAARKATHGIQVVGLAVDKPAPVQKFLQRQPLAFPVGMAAEGSQLTRDLGNLNGGLPFTVFLGSDGKLRQRKIGELSAQDLAQWAQS
ncbi:TlpA disulfide reductase family protein [Pantoea sp. 18069]|uniref:TlpA family protein disulfide reductase n=1 Tax=Pantoea sp. 18069 TaxID=2681415 RepID=UPI00135C2243|nr:TlpA disulfide reductase family protein [Pantoea sp. 18069]